MSAVAEVEGAEAAPAREKVRSRHSLASRIAFLLFVAMVVVVPLPDGSVGLFWVEVWTAACALIVVLAGFRGAGRQEALLFAGFLVVLLAYGVVAWLQSISPGPSPQEIWQRAGALLGTQLPPLSGAVVGSPLLFLGRPLLAVLALMAGIAVGRDARRADIVLRAFVYSAMAYGLVGVVALALSLDELRPFAQGTALTAFFINRNTTATYLGSAFLVVVALILVPMVRRSGTGGKVIDFERVKEVKGAFPLLVAAMVLLVLLPLTQSRAGLLITLALAAGALALRLPRQRRVMIATAIAVLVLFAVVYGISGDVWRERQARLGFESGRLDAYMLMLGAIAERPMLGYGLGTFTETFPQFRDESLLLAGVFNIGHSTPLELAFEGGVPLALIVVGFAVIVAAMLIRGAIRRPGDPYILTAVLVGLLGTLHSSIDFSLQIPGYLIVCFAVVGLGLGRVFLPREEVRRRSVRRRSSGRRDEEGEAQGAAAPAA